MYLYMYTHKDNYNSLLSDKFVSLAVLFGSLIAFSLSKSLIVYVYCADLLKQVKVYM